MKIVVATSQVPFVRGGAEIHAENLIKALRQEGHEAEIVAMPFKWYPPEKILDAMLCCRLTDLSLTCGETIDRMIALKFPAYLIPHPHKIVWLLHQHRQAYEIWGTKFGDMEYYANGWQVRQAIINADNKILGENIPLYANSVNVAQRLKKFNNIDATPLYHPPNNDENFYTDGYDDYFFYPSRLNPTKRQYLVIEALAKTRNNVKVVFAGRADNDDDLKELKKMVETLGLKNRVVFLGSISESDKLKYYAQCLGVIYPPYEEDYGYITLEGMLSAKAVISCNDSGGPTELIKHRQTGLIVEPEAQEIAMALDELWENKSLAEKLGKAGKDYYSSLNISWSHVVKTLLK